MKSEKEGTKICLDVKSARLGDSNFFSMQPY